jgi:hypothetical protein
VSLAPATSRTHPSQRGVRIVSALMTCLSEHQLSRPLDLTFEWTPPTSSVVANV